MKKLFITFLTVIALTTVFALSGVSVSAHASDSAADEGSVVLDLDFSDSAIESEFGNGWTTGWHVVDGTFRTTAPWESAYYKTPIDFVDKRIVITFDFFIQHGTDFPIFSFGVVDDPACLIEEDWGASGVTFRVYKLWESLYTSYTGSPECRLVDTQMKLCSEDPVEHKLEMTFDMDKTVTVKLDGEVMMHSDGNSMYKVNYGEIHVFSAGYLAMKSTGVNTYVDNLKVVAYNTPAQEEPISTDDPDPSGDVSVGLSNGTDSGNFEGENGGNTLKVENKESGGCGSSIKGIGAISAVSFALAAAVISVKRISKNRDR